MQQKVIDFYKQVAISEERKQWQNTLSILVCTASDFWQLIFQLMQTFLTYST